MYQKGVFIFKGSAVHIELYLFRGNVEQGVKFLITIKKAGTSYQAGCCVFVDYCPLVVYYNFDSTL